ncbi:hypothetical protein Zmor_005037 [Zophobas morio]|uniref:Odorant receptor n=1 Tax=Zophobas morio TaxID=2755281 RepID=A0AA38IUG2_9CUCU|nr:hypothetical protein Zmor_005037 [Zophobas morio]
MEYNNILRDDSLFPLLTLPKILILSKTMQKMCLFYCSFMLITAVADLIVVALTNQWNLVFTRYSSLCGGFLIVITSYVSLYHPARVNMFVNTYNKIFPSLWSLYGCRHKFEKIASLAKIFALFMTAAVLIVATAALPWYGDEYYLYFPVKVAVDYFNKYALNVYLFFFYTYFYHAALTLIANIFSLTYLILHLYNQFCMLNEKLKTLPDNQHQDLVKQELISCIKLHQTLLEYIKLINALLYYPIYFYSAGEFTIGLTIILCPKSTLMDLLRAILAAVITVSAVAGGCFFGQILENASEETLNSAYSAPWYTWNTKNRKLFLLFLQLTERKAILSTSGVITVNYQLLIGLFRAIYSSVMCIVHLRSNKG